MVHLQLLALQLVQTCHPTPPACTSLISKFDASHFPYPNMIAKRYMITIDCFCSPQVHNSTPHPNLQPLQSVEPCMWAPKDVGVSQNRGHFSNSFSNMSCIERVHGPIPTEHKMPQTQFSRARNHISSNTRSANPGGDTPLFGDQSEGLFGAVVQRASGRVKGQIPLAYYR